MAKLSEGCGGFVIIINCFISREEDEEFEDSDDGGGSKSGDAYSANENHADESVMASMGVYLSPRLLHMV